MTFTNRFVMLLACLAVCAVAHANGINAPPSKSVRLPAILSALGMIGVVAVATRRNRRERQSPEPLTDTGRKRLKGAAVCSWMSVALLGATILLVNFSPWMFDALPFLLLAAGGVAGIAGFVISIRERGNAILAAIPPMLYLVPVLLVLYARR